MTATSYGVSLEGSSSISAVGYLHSSGSVLADSCVNRCTACARAFLRIMFYVQRQALNRPLFQRASACYTHTIVVLDTAWPWASEAYGLCRLRAYFCARKLIRKIIRPYRSSDRRLRALLFARILFARITYARKIISCYSPNRDSYGVLTANKNELRALSKGCRRWCWCCGPGCWCCELAERAFKTGGGAGRVLAPLPVLSAGKARRRWCQLVVCAVEAP